MRRASEAATELFLEVENLHLIASDTAVVATWIALADKAWAKMNSPAGSNKM
jgi:hypothetical protein